MTTKFIRKPENARRTKLGILDEPLWIFAHSLAKRNKRSSLHRPRVSRHVCVWQTGRISEKRNAQSSSRCQRSLPNGQCLPDVGPTQQLAQGDNGRADLALLDEAQFAHMVRADDDDRRPVRTKLVARQLGS